MRVLRLPQCLVSLSKFAFIFALWSSSKAALAQNYSFSNYRLSNHGTARHLGLAGATAALPQSDMAALENPAAAAFQEGLLQGSVGIGSSKNTSPNLSGAPDQQQNAFTVALAARPLGFLGVTGAYDTDTQINSRQLNARTSSGTKLTQTQVPLSVSVRALSQLSLGISYVYLSSQVERLSGGSSMASDSVGSQKFSGAAWKLSLLYALSDEFSLAVTNQSQAILKQSSQSGGTVANVSQSYVPAKAQVGLAYLLVSQGEPAFFTPLENIFSLQLDIVYVPFLDSDQLLLSPLGLTLEANSKVQSFTTDKLRNDDSLAFDRRPKFIPKLGIETTWLRTREFSATTWGGAYFEPQLFQAADDDATHLTLGLELTAWFLVAQVAFDFGKGSPTQVYSAGVALR